MAISIKKFIISKFEIIIGRKLTCVEHNVLWKIILLIFSYYSSRILLLGLYFNFKF